MNTSMFPHVTIGYKAKGAINHIVLNTIVRKKFLDKWYLIPMSQSTPMKTAGLEEGVKIQAIFDFNEACYKVLMMTQFSVASQSAILDPEQNDEMDRLASYYGIGVPAIDELEYNEKGDVVVKYKYPEEIKESVPKKPRPMRRPTPKPIFKDEVKEQEESGKGIAEKAKISNPALRKIVNKEN